jgi:hypothetical protein
MGAKTSLWSRLLAQKPPGALVVTAPATPAPPQHDRRVATIADENAVMLFHRARHQT